MDHPLRTISYIADIGNIVVLMARRRMPRSNSQENVEASHPSQDGKRQYKMICHVFESEDVRLPPLVSLWVTWAAPGGGGRFSLSQNLNHLINRTRNRYLLSTYYVSSTALGI